MDMMEKLSLAGLVPVIKVEDAADAVPLCRALSKGGLPVAEITFRTDAAEEAIRRVHEELPEVMLGAGTVLTKEQVDRAVAAGAAYIVSPGLNREIVRYCREKGVQIIHRRHQNVGHKIIIHIGIVPFNDITNQIGHVQEGAGTSTAANAGIENNLQCTHRAAGRGSQQCADHRL